MASHLRVPLSVVERLPYQEVQQRLIWMDQEQIGPAWDRFRHAELLAATLNGQCRRSDGRPFMAADFLTDPWAEPKVLTAEEQRRQIAMELEAMADAFGG